MKRLIDAIANAKCVGCLTGAGVPTLCGIPDFRGPQGLYKNPDAAGVYRDLAEFAEAVSAL